MNLKIDRLNLLDVTMGRNTCGNCEEIYKEKLLQYLENEAWGDVQAYFEMRAWEKYHQVITKLAQDSREIGACKLAEMLDPLAVAAKEENPYYIEKHQAEAMRVYLAILEEIENAVENHDVLKTEVLTEKTAHILLVDDEIESLEQAESILSSFYHVSRAESANEALEIMKKNSPDLVMIDIYMPETDGFEMMKLLQQEELGKDIPVILFTTEHSQEIEVRSFKAGAQDFVTKPFRADIILRRVSRILELSKLQKDLQREVEKQTRQAEERRKQVERLSDQIISALAETIDAKDTYTNGHSLRVAQYSVEIAKRAGKNEEEQECIYYMGMLHDIGKIGIPDAIITKNSGLSDKEYVMTRKHPEIGAEILATISEIPDLGIGARWHHERYDGTGYPDGLKGMEIPEEARLIAVADAYDAMASKRSYRDVLPQNVIYEEIKKGRGTQFDPVFADIMLTMMEEDKDYNMREK